MSKHPIDGIELAKKDPGRWLLLCRPDRWDPAQRLRRKLARLKRRLRRPHDKPSP